MEDLAYNKHTIIFTKHVIICQQPSVIFMLQIELEVVWPANRYLVFYFILYM